MKNLKIIQILVLSITILFMSCASEGDYSKMSVQPELMQAVEQAKEEVADVANVPLERKIIKEGSIRFKTDDAATTRDLIKTVLKENGGYVAKDNVYDYNGSIEHTIEVRVPSENFDKLLEQISQSAQKLDSKNISARDVTEEYIDIEARIKTKSELEARYSALLSMAVTVEEILTIEREIGALREDIESIQGRLRYLKDQVSLSTLTITFYSETGNTMGFGSKFISALGSGVDNLLWLLIGLTHIWPFLLIVAGGVIFGIRMTKKNSSKQ